MGKVWIGKKSFNYLYLFLYFCPTAETKEVRTARCEKKKELWDKSHNSEEKKFEINFAINSQFIFSHFFLRIAIKSHNCKISTFSTFYFHTSVLYTAYNFFLFFNEKHLMNRVKLKLLFCDWNITSEWIIQTVKKIGLKRTIRS